MKKVAIINDKEVEYEDLRDLYNQLFDAAGTELIENYDIKIRSEFTQALLTNILQTLEKNENKYNKLRIEASWNPAQVVEVEPSQERKDSRKVFVKPTK